MKKSVVHAQKQLYMAVRSKDYLLFLHINKNDESSCS
jgi:hypothetical protein